MASLMASPVTNTDRLRESRRKRKKKSLFLYPLQTSAENRNQMIEKNIWKTATQQQNYSSKLLQALHRVRETPPSAPAPSNFVPRRGRAIKDAADRVLAVTAKGRTRWSRAILTNRLKLKFLKAKKPKVVPPNRIIRKAPRMSLVPIKPKNLPAVQKKALLLGSLVPGCRKQPLSVVLEEAHDYISALEMQVKAMTALAELLSVAGAVSGSLDHPPPPPAP